MPPAAPRLICTCRKCGGGKHVSRSTYYQHKSLRLEAALSLEFISYMEKGKASSEQGNAGTSTMSQWFLSPPPPPPSRKRRKLDDISNQGEGVAPSESQTLNGQNGDPFEGIDNLEQPEDVTFPPNPPALESNINQDDLLGEDEIDDDNHDIEIQNPGDDRGDADLPPPSHAELDTTEIRAVCIDEIKISNGFIDLVKNARLGDEYDNLDPVYLERLRNPPQDCIDVDDPDLRLCLDIYLHTSNSSQKAYDNLCKATLRQFPQSGFKPLSYYQVQRRIAELTGVVPITHDMCINTCLAFTGVWSGQDTCPKCGTSRYDPLRSRAGKKVPRQQFYTIPIGPQLQALWRTPNGANHLCYRERRTKELLAELDKNQTLDVYDNILCGSDYLLAVQDGRISKDDMVLMLSIDGAQLYEKKTSDCWIYIWVLVDHAPDTRYKKRHVLPGGFIPGPKKPKNLDSFLFPGLHHLSALQTEGLRIWDAAEARLFISYLFFILACADSPAMALISGLVGHHGKKGCRLYCPLKGCHKDGAPYYYPVRLKPLYYTVDGSDHDDVPIQRLLDMEHQRETYLQALSHLSIAKNRKQYEERRLATGICKSSIFSGLVHSLSVPRCFSLDIMHLITLNLTELLLKLWRGTMECDSGDSKQTWDWAVLTGDIWKDHGKAVAAATPYLPGSFDRPPRNPAEKVNSGYKAMEFLNYFYVLRPGVFYGVLPIKYWQHFCKLVSGIRLIYQTRITLTQLQHAHRTLLEFANEFELLYYQRKDTRIHIVRMSIHLLHHLAPEVSHIGPGICSSQWTMECVIGMLASEVKQHSNPYANLSQRGLRRSQINALSAMIPDFVPPKNNVPRGGIDLDDGYILLHPADRVARPITSLESAAIDAFLAKLGARGEPIEKVVRWGRLQLPTGQTARCNWKEGQKPLEKLRMARVVKFHLNDRDQIGIVQYYLHLLVNNNPHTVAMIASYSDPDPYLLSSSERTLYSCLLPSDDNLIIVPVKTIVSVVGMVPHMPNIPGKPSEMRYFLAEQMMLDVLELPDDDSNNTDV